MNRGRKITYGLSLIATLLLIVYLVIPETKIVTVRIVTPPLIIASLPHWVAEELNYYTDEHLDVKTTSYNNSAGMVGALYAGDADFLPAVSLVDVVQASYFKGSDRAVIISHSRMRPSPPFEGLIVPVGSDISTFLDLENKSIGVYPGITSAATVKYFLEKNGVNVSKIKFIKLAPPHHLGALMRGDIAASHSYDPFKTQFIANGSARALGDSLYGSLNNPSAIGVSVISSDFLKNNPAGARKIALVWNKSIDFIRNNPKKAREILARKLKLKSNVAKDAVWVDATRTDEISIADVKATIATMQQAGVIDKQANLSNKSFYKD